MLDKRKFTLISLINFALLSGSAIAQKIDTEPANQIVVEEGQKTTFLCRYGEPLIFCRIEVAGEESFNLSPDWPASKPGFSYFGDGLQSGQCGITIDRVPASANGQIKCHLGLRGPEISKEISLIVAVAPDPPQMAVSEKARNNDLVVNEEFIAECVARGGRPAANISFYLDQEPIEQYGTQEVHEKLGRDNTTTFEASHTISWNLRASDNGRMLICRASHFAYPNNYSDASTQIIVNYRPQPLAEIRIFGLVLQSTATINVTIGSNPRPNIEWIIDGESIPQGTQHGRYEAHQPTDLGRGDYNITMKIAGLTLEDTTKIYRLRASNSFGVQEYVVRISSSEAAPDSGLAIGSIIAIIVACAVVLIAVILVVVARLTGRWCFADHSAAHTKPSETSDTESVDVKPLTLPTSDEKKIPFTKLFFRKPKTSDTELVAQTETKEGDTNVQQKSNDDVENGEAKDDGKLVYAELQLKTVADPPTVSKETTEYAEILYVTPPAASAETNDAPPPQK